MRSGVRTGRGTRRGGASPPDRARTATPSRAGRRRGAAAPSRRRRRPGEEAVDQQALPRPGPRVRSTSALSVPPISFEPRPTGIATGHRLRRRRGRRAASPSRAGTRATSARCCIASSRRGLPEGDFARSRPTSAASSEIHVVAPEQDVVADRDPLEREVAGVAGDLDQREVGGAAADVAHQHHAARGQILAPVASPRVAEVRVIERRLRLLEQRHLVDSAGSSRAATTVSSRATGSNDAGTVTSTSCSSAGSSGLASFHAARRCAR